MASDILERAKAVDPEMLAVLNRGALRDLISGLIAEVERLRSENRELKKTDVWANDVIKEHESLNARIKALEAELENLNGMGTVGYMLGYKKGGDGNKVLIDYIKRLEAAFLRSNAAMRYYQEGNRGPWPQVGEQFKEPYIQKAREALERIKEDGKDEEL